MVVVAPGARTEATGLSAAECAYDPSKRAVTVIVDPGDSAHVAGSTGVIGLGTMSGVLPCGAATTTNTDLIAVRVSDESGQRAPFVHLPLGETLAPGFTDEPGNSDEIELEVDFGTSGGYVNLLGHPDEAIDVALGRDEINTNAAEKSGIDADITVRGASLVGIYGLTRKSHAVDGSGGRGTPAEPFATRMQVSLSSAGRSFAHGGFGDDGFTTFGGDDFIAGGPGNDSASSQEGQDELVGGPGNDFLRAGEDNDELRGGPGKDRLIAEGGRDRCRGGPGDRLSSCERRD